jgi:hypothetical protein
MKNRSAVRSVLFGAVLLSLIPTSVTAQAQYPTPPFQPVLLNVPLVNQDTDMWCWLASSEMIIQYRRPGLTYQQCRIMEMGYGQLPGSCCGNEYMCRIGGDWPQIMTVLARFGGITGAVMPALNEAALYRTLSSGFPIIAKIRSGAASMHAVVIKGMYYQPMTFYSPFGQSYQQWIPFVAINDPMSYLPREVPFNQLANVWIQSLIASY